jgi:nucleoside phosphorylase
VDAKLVGRLKDWQRNQEQLDRIRTSWSGAEAKTVLRLHIGPLFSAPTVVANEDSVAAIHSQWRKLIGVEMEAYAVHRACSDTIDDQPLFLCLKSICDFADKKKDDRWQEYAAFTSASFFHRFLVEEWSTIA